MPHPMISRPDSMWLQRALMLLLLGVGQELFGRCCIWAQFTQGQILSGQTELPQDCWAGDMDGDGDMDVLSASSSDGTIAWYKNLNGFGNFGPQLVISSSSLFPRTLQAADLDGDGDQDVLTADFVDQTIIWYENIDGQGTFGPTRLIATMAGVAEAVIAADLTGDGNLDVVMASSSLNKIVWYENVGGAGNFGPEQLITGAANGADSVFAIDLDGDGDLDVLGTALGGDEFAWFENSDGVGSFGSKQLITMTASGPTQGLAGDLDGDGDMDAVLASSFDDTVAWFRNEDGVGGFGLGSTISSSVCFVQDVLIDDLDIDGDSDVIAAAFGDDEVSWFRNTDGAGTFGPKNVITTGARSVLAVFAGDLTGDGASDVISADSGDNEIAWYQNLNGLGDFGPERLITSEADFAEAVHAEDLDGDGDMDILSASSGDNKIAWYENLDGRGSFGFERIIETQALGAIAVLTGDVDGDGDQDVISGSNSDKSVTWYENLDGQGTFGPPRVITSNTGTTLSVHAGDLDGDGDLDIVSGSSTFLGVDPLEWYRNLNGMGDFSAPIILPTDSGLISTVLVADLDSDGDMDVLAGSTSPSKIIWFENSDGAGLFSSEQVLTSDVAGVQQISAADLDADGDIDLLSASSLDDTLAWYPNLDGLGQLGSRQVIDVLTAAESLFAVDLDGDHDLDLAATSYNGNELVWYENLDGLANFGPKQVVEDEENLANWVYAADLDRDGDPDLISAASSDNRVTWYENLRPSFPYGSDANPARSLIIAAGSSVIGGSLTFGIDNPLGTQAPGSSSFLVVSTDPDPGFPAGTLIPGFGMQGPGAAGELLVSLSPASLAVPLLAGPSWAGPGLPALIQVDIPNDAVLVGLSFFAQGLLLDPTVAFGVRFGLTTGYRVTVIN